MNKLNLYDKILFPVVTEKSTNLSEQNKVIFKVPFSSDKKSLKKNVEKSERYKNKYYKQKN